MPKLAQFSSATMLGTLLAGLLIVGMLHFPSTCLCGTQLPHTHSLFQLAGHHHAQRATRGDTEHHQTGSAARSSTAQAVDGPTLVQPTNSDVKTALFISAVAGLAHAAGRPLRRRRPTRQDNPHGQVVSPEPGPPKPYSRAAASGGRAQP